MAPQNWFITILVALATILSLVSVIKPQIIANHMRRGRLWKWYFKILGISQKKIDEDNIELKLRLQGAAVLAILILIFVNKGH